MQELLWLFISPILRLPMAKAIYSFLNVIISIYTSSFTESTGSVKVYGTKTQLSQHGPSPARNGPLKKSLTQKILTQKRAIHSSGDSQQQEGVMGL